MCCHLVFDLGQPTGILASHRGYIALYSLRYSFLPQYPRHAPIPPHLQAVSGSLPPPDSRLPPLTLELCSPHSYIRQSSVKYSQYQEMARTASISFLRCLARAAAPGLGASRLQLSVLQLDCCFPFCARRRVIAEFAF